MLDGHLGADGGGGHLSKPCQVTYEQQMPGDEMKKTTTAKRTTKARAMIRGRTRIRAARR
jgi:hypothetical protein